MGDGEGWIQVCVSVCEFVCVFGHELQNERIHSDVCAHASAYVRGYMLRREREEKMKRRGDKML